MEREQLLRAKDARVVATQQHTHRQLVLDHILVPKTLCPLAADKIARFAEILDRRNQRPRALSRALQHLQGHLVRRHEITGILENRNQIAGMGSPDSWIQLHGPAVAVNCLLVLHQLMLHQP